jgi:4-amino-4-deoxy-L-arabinose transferase-like glycosyltransferase
MTVGRSLVLVAMVAALHGLFFIWYQRPDWHTEWSDQDGYRRLGQVLAATGRFTRFPDAPEFVPEVIRTPAYPMFLALIYRIAGFGQLPVALVQTALFVIICLFTYRIASELLRPGVAVAAAWMAALFAPIPYFGALVMTEVWTTFLFVVSTYVGLRLMASPTTPKALGLGVLLAATTLSRPVFVLFPFVLAGLALVASPVLGVRLRPQSRHWLGLMVAFTIAMLPWLGYNYVTLGRLTLSPAGGIGRGLWEGSWQATWPGRLQNELTRTAEELDDRPALDRRVRSIAGRERLSAEPMLDYVHQWQDIRRIWTTPTDPNARALARIEADHEYLRVALQNLGRDRPGHVMKRLARGLFVLWAGEIPFRYSVINRLPPWMIYLCWSLQATLLLGAVVGVWALARSGRGAHAFLLGLPIAYVTAVHVLLLTEARQSLPAMPIVVVLAVTGVASLVGSLPLEAQVHEREHL